jgi:hypothetical protein
VAAVGVEVAAEVAAEVADTKRARRRGQAEVEAAAVPAVAAAMLAAVVEVVVEVAAEEVVVSTLRRFAGNIDIFVCWVDACGSCTLCVERWILDFVSRLRVLQRAIGELAAYTAIGSMMQVPACSG